MIKKTQTIKNKWKLITTYVYDDENRLIEVKIQKGHKIREVSFTYDPLGRRISKTVGRADFEDEDEEDADEDDKGKGKGKGKDSDKEKGKWGKPFQPRTTYYVYDDQNVIAEYDENGKLIASYIHGPNIDEPLSAEIRRDWIYYHADGLGSITALTSHMGHTIQKYEYDSFGNMRPHPHWITQPFTYTGREFDQETGLYYYRARYYDAKAGRFITRDPIGFEGGDVNLYVYTGNNPINYVDPEGLAASCTYTKTKGRNGTLTCTFSSEAKKKCCEDFTSSAFSGNGRETSETKEGGPIPNGSWKIYEPGWIAKRPNWAYLVPLGHNAHGRTEFFIHGPGTRNIGCISVKENYKTLIDCLKHDKGGFLEVK